MKEGDKIKVVWKVKDATAKAWENVTLARIVQLGPNETIAFCKEFPFCAFNINNATIVESV